MLKNIDHKVNNLNETIVIAINSVNFLDAVGYFRHSAPELNA